LAASAKESTKLKILLQILLIGIIGNIYSQSNSESLKDFIKKEIHKDNQNELTIELTNVIVKTKSKLAIDINSVDTLYIVRGLDIQSRKGYGRLWNSDFVIHYSDAKKWKNNKIVGSKAQISNNKKDNVTTNFNPIIKYVEIGDFKYLKKYAKDNSVFSGINWLIIRLYRTKKDVKIDCYSLDDFDKL
jgi:hypothetical protein